MCNNHTVFAHDFADFILCNYVWYAFVATAPFVIEMIIISLRTVFKHWLFVCFCCRHINVFWTHSQQYIIVLQHHIKCVCLFCSMMNSWMVRSSQHRIPLCCLINFIFTDRFWFVWNLIDCVLCAHMCVVYILNVTQSQKCLCWVQNPCGTWFVRLFCDFAKGRTNFFYYLLLSLSLIPSLHCLFHCFTSLRSSYSMSWPQSNCVSGCTITRKTNRLKCTNNDDDDVC